MKKYICLACVTLIFSNNSIFPQPWHFDFGTIQQNSTFNFPDSLCESFFSSSPEIGSSFIYVGNAGGGFYLANPGIVDLGSEYELQCIASNQTTNNNINKFSLYGCSDTKVFYINFSVRFAGGVDGAWYFFMGNGNYFQNSYRWIPADVFGGIKWSYKDPDSVETYALIDASNWGNNPELKVMKNNNYNFEIFANNTGAELSYNSINNAQHLLPEYSYDIWINSEFKINRTKANTLLIDNAIINSFMFLGEGSIANIDTIFIDDIVYSNNFNNITSAEVTDISPSIFLLYQNYPNPFNPTTKISFLLPKSTNIKISVFNSLGETVKILVDELRHAGFYETDFDASDLPSGIYFYKISTPEYSNTKKMIFLK